MFGLIYTLAWKCVMGNSMIVYFHLILYCIRTIICGTKRLNTEWNRETLRVFPYGIFIRHVFTRFMHKSSTHSYIFILYICKFRESFLRLEMMTLVYLLLLLLLLCFVHELGVELSLFGWMANIHLQISNLCKDLHVKINFNVIAFISNGIWYRWYRHPLRR